MSWDQRERSAWTRLMDGHELSLAEKAVLFIRSMRLWAKDGFRVTTRSVAEHRLRICARHPECWIKPPLGPRRCSRCGCYSPKQWLRASTCPRGFWGSA